MSLFRRLSDALRRRGQLIHGRWHMALSPRPLGADAGSYGTVYFDYEGRWAMPGQDKASRRGAEHVLASLARAGVKASFNCVGRMIDDAPDLMRRIATEGHEIASHTLEHSVVQRWSARQMQEDMLAVRALLAPVSDRIIGFRATQSRWSLPVLAGLRAAGVLWNAENDLAPEPYLLGQATTGRLWRMPIRIDDWDFQRQRLDGAAMLARWKAAEARAQGQYFAIGFHPWVLAQSEDRLAAFDAILTYLAARRRLMSFGQMRELCEARLAQ